MSKRKSILIEKEEKDAMQHCEKCPDWSWNEFEVASEGDLQRVLAEIEPLVESAQSVIVNPHPFCRDLNLIWSNLDDFQLDDKSEKNCCLRFRATFRKQNSLTLFRWLFQTARMISRLELTNCEEDSLPPLKEIIACLSRDGYWRLRLRHLKLWGFLVAQNSFEGIQTFPEQMKSLDMSNCSYDGSGIDYFLSRLTSLETCEIRSYNDSHAPLFRIVENSIRDMAELQKLTLFGEANSRDTDAMEGFVENIARLKGLRSFTVFLFAYDNAFIAEAGGDNLQDKLLKILPRTTISRFHCKTFDRTHENQIERPVLFGLESIDALLDYVANRGKCKLSYISLDYSSFVPAGPARDYLETPTDFERRILDTVSKALSISKLTLPIVDTRPPVEDLYTNNIHVPHRRRCSFMAREEKARLLSAKIMYILNSFYFPIINALAERDLPLGLWPQVLTKSIPDRNLHRWESDYLKFEPNQSLHASALFILLRGRPGIVGGSNCDQ